MPASVPLRAMMHVRTLFCVSVLCNETECWDKIDERGEGIGDMFAMDDGMWYVRCVRLTETCSGYGLIVVKGYYAVYGCQVLVRGRIWSCDDWFVQREYGSQRASGPSDNVVFIDYIFIYSSQYMLNKDLVRIVLYCSCIIFNDPKYSKRFRI